MASVPPAVYEPAVAVASADIFLQAPSSIVAAAVATAGTAVHEPAVLFASLDILLQHPTALLRLLRVLSPLRSSFELLLGLGATPRVLTRARLVVPTVLM